jgi:D-glycero-alpha-D-manno-heptose-7-phosphate kinase
VIIVRTPLRVSLVGGGTDLPSFYQKESFGQVLSFAIDKYIYLTIHPLVDETQILLKYSKSEMVTSISDLQHPIVREILKMYELKGVDISVTSDVPSGSGLGSSSAFTVSFFHLIREYLKMESSRTQLAALAADLEINTLASPIGKQDQYASALGGINRLRFNNDNSVDVHKIDLKQNQMEYLNACIFLIKVGEQREANTILQDQNKSMKQNRDLSGYLRMRELVELAEKSLLANDYPQIGRVINESWEIKKRFSTKISTPEIDKIITELLIAGVWGAKLLGAGQGGYVLAFADPNLRLLLTQQYRSRIIIPRIDVQGSTVVYKNE